MASNVSELRKLAADLRKGGAQVETLAKKAVAKTALDIEADAKRLAPVDTGNLRNSISHSFPIKARGLAAEVGPTAAYGVHVEFGTARQAPQPYMMPAADRRLPIFEKALEVIVSKVL